MNATTNAASLREGYAAFATGDMTTLDTLFADDVVWHVAGRSPLSGIYKGKEQLFGGFFAELGQRAGGTFTAEISSLVAEGDTVVALVNHSGTREGRTLSTQDILVFRFDAGRVVEVHHTSFNPYQTDGFWS